MDASFFKVALRNFTRRRGFTLINLFGLTLGLTACFLIGLFIYDEKQYDRFLPGHQNIYRLGTHQLDGNNDYETPRTPPMYATSLNQQFPEVQQATRVFDLLTRNLFEKEAQKIYEEGGIAADSNFFSVFPLPTHFGTLQNSLTEPRSIVLTKEMSQKYFGSENPVGQQILVDKNPFIVKAVINTDQLKFHLKPNYIIDMRTALELNQVRPQKMQSWGWQQFYTYVQVKPQANVQVLQSKFFELAKKESEPSPSGAFESQPFFQPLERVHLYSSKMVLDIAVRGNITYVKALSAIAVFILLIACFNFINLATAQSLQRAKEVGVRKSIGASRGQLITQFTGETVILTLISVILSVALASLLLPQLNRFTDKNIAESVLVNPFFLTLAVLLGLVVGILSGLYPALVLSRFRPVVVLKSSKSGDATPGKIPWVRHALVVLQFGLSSILIVAAIVVFRQVNYLHNKDLGLNKEEVMYFPMHGDKMYEQYAQFKEELTADPSVSSVTVGYGFPGDMFAGEDIVVPSPSGPSNHHTTMLLADVDYAKTFGLKFVAGRDFSKDIPTDADEAFIINETAAREFGFGRPQDAINKLMEWEVWGASTPDSMKRGRVIGVVKDFNFKSLYERVEPAVLQIFPGANWKVAVKFNSANVDKTVAYVKKVWQRFAPDYPIEYKFLDERFDELYRNEDKLRSLLYIFTSIAVAVGCLGLFGLAAYAAQRRAKEVSIRKVLGSSSRGLVLLLSRNFIVLVLVALLLGAPVAWYVMNQWLEDFPYRIGLDWWVFALAAALVLMIAFLTVSIQAIRAVLANPAKVLRSE